MLLYMPASHSNHPQSSWAQAMLQCCDRFHSALDL